MKRALLASYEKDEHIVRLARLLSQYGYSLWGSSGTAKFLNERAVPCEDVKSFVGPPILGHRVVTLARKIHAALLSRPEDSAELDRLGIRPFVVVYVTFYPLEKTLGSPHVTPEDVIEQTDIGGPTLVRAAAKGRRIVLTDPAQIDLFESWLKGGAREKERKTLVSKLVAAAERRVANYVDASARYWEGEVAKLE